MTKASATPGLAAKWRAHWYYQLHSGAVVERILTDDMNGHEMHGFRVAGYNRVGQLRQGLMIVQEQEYEATKARQRNFSRRPSALAVSTNTLPTTQAFAYKVRVGILVSVVFALHLLLNSRSQLHQGLNAP